MQISNKIVLGAIGAFAILMVAAGISYQQKSDAVERAVRMLDDVTMGKTVGGSLRSETGQFLCFDPVDLYTGTYGASSDVNGAQDAIDNRLIQQSRCTFSDSRDGFEMDAEGRQVYLTPDGPISLWARH